MMLLVISPLELPLNEKPERASRKSAFILSPLSKATERFSGSDHFSNTVTQGLITDTNIQH